MSDRKDEKRKSKDWSGTVTSVKRAISGKGDKFFLLSAESGKEKREFLLRRE